MSDLKKAPSTKALARAAAGGNLTLEVGEAIEGWVDQEAERRARAMAGGRPGGLGDPFSPGWRPGGFALGAIIPPVVQGRGLLVGALIGIPAGQVVKDVLLVQGLKMNPLAAGVATAGAGVLLHLLARTSLTLGLGIALLTPLVSELTRWLFEKFGVAGLSGAAPRHGADLGRSTLAQLDALKQRMVQPRAA